jgi:hypothetical protein
MLNCYCIIANSLIFIPAVILLTYLIWTTLEISLGAVVIYFLSTNKNIIQRDLEKYDILIGCGLAPAYTLKANRHLDIFNPYGGDIWTETFYRLLSPHIIPSTWQSVHYQRKAISMAKIFHMSKTNKNYESQYEKYRGRSVRWYEGMPMVYSPMYNSEMLEDFKSKTHWAEEFAKVRSQTEFMVISHMRHYWGSNQDPATKGNDILLNGWKIFTNRHNKLNAKLILLEYGRDVYKSKKLIGELNLSESVAWFPLMYRKDIMYGLHLSDIVCGEFVNSWITGGVLYEGLVAGKPILAHRDEGNYFDKNPNLYPILNANSAEMIADRLEEYLYDSEKLKKYGEVGRTWYENEVVNKCIDKYENYILDYN